MCISTWKFAFLSSRVQISIQTVRPGSEGWVWRAGGTMQCANALEQLRRVDLKRTWRFLLVVCSAVECWQCSCSSLVRPGLQSLSDRTSVTLAPVPQLSADSLRERLYADLPNPAVCIPSRPAETAQLWETEQIGCCLVLPKNCLSSNQ